MLKLVVAPDWGAQIARLREQLTEDTNLIRFGNNFYRCCRPGGLVSVALHASKGGARLELQIRSDDLYITRFGLAQPMGRYSSLTDDMVASAGALDNAVHALAGGHASGKRAFDQRSLVTFCVAEALRFDHLADDLGRAFICDRPAVVGAKVPMPVADWWQLVHQWGQACDAVWAMLPPDMRATASSSRASLSAPQRQAFTMVPLDRIPAHLRECVRKMRVLKRP